MDGFGLHASQELRDLFTGMEIPHQGQDLIRQIGQTQVHKVMHFSALVGLEQLRELGRLVRDWCSALCADHQL